MPSNSLPVPIGQLVIDVEVPDLFAVGEFGEIVVDLIDRRHHCRVVVARENACQDDGGAGGLGFHDSQYGLDTRGDVRCFGLIAARGDGIADVIGSGEQHDDFRIDSVQFPMV